MKRWCFAVLLLSILPLVSIMAQEDPGRLKGSPDPYAVPNPFRRSVATNVLFVIPREWKSSAAYRLTDVYSASGVFIRRLRAQSRSNAYQVRWDGHDGEGEAVPPGLYFIQVHGGNPPPPQPLVFSLLLVR